MEWRDGYVIPGDYASANEKYPIVGGGSTKLTKYYQQTAKRGDELKETHVQSLNLGTADIWDMTDTGNWPGNWATCMAVTQGPEYYQRTSVNTWGLRLQIKVRANWANKTASGGTTIFPPMQSKKIFVHVVRLTLPSAGGQKFPDANQLIDQTYMTPLPISKKSPKAEILAWAILEGDRSYYKEVVDPVTLDGTPTGAYITEQRWGAHTTEVDFDIDLKGSLFKWRKGNFSNTVNQDIVIHAVWADSTAGNLDILAAGGLTADSWFSWSETPPNRLWAPDKIVGHVYGDRQYGQEPPSWWRSRFRTLDEESYALDDAKRQRI
jgi:hypothetical protein